MEEKMKMIFTSEEIARITKELKNNACLITVDTHGLKLTSSHS